MSMFGKASQGDLNGFLDAGSRIRGELGFEDTFRVDGHIEGSVVSDGVLIVGDRGEIDGEIKVRKVYVSGIVRGRLEAAEYLEITPTGRVFADLETPSLKIEEGAVFEGSCSMGGAASAAKSRPKPQSTDGDSDAERLSNVTQMPVAKA